MPSVEERARALLRKDIFDRHGIKFRGNCNSPAMKQQRDTLEERDKAAYTTKASLELEDDEKRRMSQAKQGKGKKQTTLVEFLKGKGGCASQTTDSMGEQDTPTPDTRPGENPAVNEYLQGEAGRSLLDGMSIDTLLDLPESLRAKLPPLTENGAEQGGGEIVDGVTDGTQVEGSRTIVEPYGAAEIPTSPIPSQPSPTSIAFQDQGDLERWTMTCTDAQMPSPVEEQTLSGSGGATPQVCEQCGKIHLTPELCSGIPEENRQCGHCEEILPESRLSQRRACGAPACTNCPPSRCIGQADDAVIKPSLAASQGLGIEGADRVL